MFVYVCLEEGLTDMTGCFHGRSSWCFHAQCTLSDLQTFCTLSRMMLMGEEEETSAADAPSSTLLTLRNKIFNFK